MIRTGMLDSIVEGGAWGFAGVLAGYLLAAMLGTG